MKAAEWIDRLKAEREWDTDYRVSKELNVSHGTLSRYRSKPDATMDDDTAVKVAEALELDAEIIIIDQVAERSRSDVARAALSGLLQRIIPPVAKHLLPKAGGAAGRDPLDITSVTQPSKDGQLQVPRSKGYASYPMARSSLGQIFAQVVKSLTYAPRLA